MDAQPRQDAHRHPPRISCALAVLDAHRDGIHRDLEKEPEQDEPAITSA